MANFGSPDGWEVDKLTLEALSLGKLALIYFMEFGLENFWLVYFSRKAV